MFRCSFKISIWCKWKNKTELQKILKICMCWVDVCTGSWRWIRICKMIKSICSTPPLLRFATLFRTVKRVRRGWFWDYTYVRDSTCRLVPVARKNGLFPSGDSLRSKCFLRPRCPWSLKRRERITLRCHALAWRRIPSKRKISPRNNGIKIAG